MKGKLFTKGKSSNELSLLKQASNFSPIISISDREILEQMRMIGLEKDDLINIHAVQPLIKENIEKLVHAFYQTILQVHHLKQIIEEHSSIDRLRSTLHKHLVEMFDGKIDNQFLEKRMRVAKVHFHIGLEPKWYLSAFQNLQNSMMEIVYDNFENKNEQRIIIHAITKILNFEQQLVLEAYDNENMKQREKENERVKEELKLKITEISEELVALAEQTSASVQTLITNSNEVNGTVSKNRDQATSTQEMARQGQERMQILANKISSISTNTEDVDKMVGRLNQSFKQISEFVNLVQDIADQTNLLSLNSAIEAARAGEHGRGFAVVANEVRKLAEQTKKSISEIQSIVSTSNNYMKEVVDSLEGVQSVVKEGRNESASTSEAFNNIVVSMDDSLTGVKNVDQKIKHLIEIIQEIGVATSKVTESAETLNDTANHL